jgi:hypothetical protein
MQTMNDTITIPARALSVGHILCTHDGRRLSITGVIVGAIVQAQAHHGNSRHTFFFPITASVTVAA